jgi:hypothetical protein
MMVSFLLFHSNYLLVVILIFNSTDKRGFNFGHSVCPYVGHGWMYDLYFYVVRMLG